MGDLHAATTAALDPILAADAAVMEIVELSLRVSLTAMLLAALLSLRLGALLAVTRYPGAAERRRGDERADGAAPVVAGLLVYLLLSRSGPLRPPGLLFTPMAMVIAQAVLIAPILAALTREALSGLWEKYAGQLRSFGAGPLRAVPTLRSDGVHRRRCAGRPCAGGSRHLAVLPQPPGSARPGRGR